MLQEITYYLILGIPFIVYLGTITIIMFILTALIALIKRKRKINISIKWHYRLAYLSIFLGIVHGILGILTYL
jgi:dolichyl-phosphate-mannose--protein O-mannosyl transferase